MKTGKSLVELATEIERQNKSKMDFVAATNRLSFGRRPSRRGVD